MTCWKSRWMPISLRTEAEERAMAKGQKKSNKEARKPKKEATKTIAAKPSTKGTLFKAD